MQKTAQPKSRTLPNTTSSAHKVSPETAKVCQQVTKSQNVPQDEFNHNSVPNHSQDYEGVNKGLEKGDAREERLAYYREYNANRREHLNEYMKERQATPDGLLKRIYSSQRFHSRKRGHQPPSYTWQELVARYIDDPQYLALYDTWIKSGKSRWTKPSLDRIDESKGYSLDNIALMTWKENCQKHIDDLKKPVAVFKGDALVGVFESQKEAGTFAGLKKRNPSHLLDTGKASSKGYFFYRIPESIANFSKQEAV